MKKTRIAALILAILLTAVLSYAGWWLHNFINVVMVK